MYTVVIIVFCIQACGAETSLKEEEQAADSVAVCFDVDGDGNVTKGEMATFLSRHKSFDKLVDSDGGRAAVINKHFIESDLDDDDVLQESETNKVAFIYTKTLKDCLKGGHIAELSSSSSNSTKDAFAMFACYDLNGDGETNKQEMTEFYIDKSSYKDELNAVGGLDKFVDRFIVGHDYNEDTIVSWKEFENVTKLYLHVIEVCHGEV